MGLCRFILKGISVSNILELNVRAKPKSVEKELPPQAGKPFGPLELGKKYLLNNGVVVGPVKEFLHGKAYIHCNVHGTVGGHMGMYFWNSVTGEFGGAEGMSSMYHIVAEFKDKLDPDFVKLKWLQGAKAFYKLEHLDTVWSQFPQANTLGNNPGTFFDSYKNSFVWKL